VGTSLSVAVEGDAREQTADSNAGIVSMRICRFNGNRLGLVEADTIWDISEHLSALPTQTWPLAFGDPLIANLESVMSRVRSGRRGDRFSVSDVQLNSPVAWPPKVVAAPANYRKHVELDTLDPGVDQGVHRAQTIGLDRPVDHLGLFLKASTSVVGPAEGITISWGADRRVDEEVEIVVVIGKTARNVRREQALDYVAGYTVGLDVTVRGAEERSFRKSPDSFAVLGPWLVTADEIPDPSDMRFWIEVNGKPRQDSSTAMITVPIPELIELASSIYTLSPGDVIFSGTPEGVGPIVPGDELRAGCDVIGEMRLLVRGPNE
jgi:2-keto-4-pentenoate hydratase/2-oxohepta-3-ene-1,7-dioic acid hydratase in catechol pathway